MTRTHTPPCPSSLCPQSACCSVQQQQQQSGPHLSQEVCVGGHAVTVCCCVLLSRAEGGEEAPDHCLHVAPPEVSAPDALVAISVNSLRLMEGGGQYECVYECVSKWDECRGGMRVDAGMKAVRAPVCVGSVGVVVVVER